MWACAAILSLIPIIFIQPQLIIIPCLFQTAQLLVWIFAVRRSTLSCLSGSCQAELFGMRLHLPWHWCIAECGKMIRRKLEISHTYEDRHALTSTFLPRHPHTHCTVTHTPTHPPTYTHTHTQTCMGCCWDIARLRLILDNRPPDTVNQVRAGGSWPRLLDDWNGSDNRGWEQSLKCAKFCDSCWRELHGDSQFHAFVCCPAWNILENFYHLSWRNTPVGIIWSSDVSKWRREELSELTAWKWKTWECTRLS